MFRWNCSNQLVSILLSVLVLVTLAPGALAQDDKWEFGAALYGWLPDITGTLAYDLPSLGTEVEIDAGTLIENLSFTIQGTLTAQRNDWGLYVDGIYLKESVNRQKVVDVGKGLTFDADFTLNNWIVNFGGLYQVARTPKGGTFNVTLGARYLYAKSDLGITGSGPAGLDGEVDSVSNVWNGIIGANGRIALGKRWFIPYLVDAGAGDSDFTYQAQGGINYAWHWGGLMLTYRYLEFDQGEDSGLQSLAMGGPELGIYFDF